MIYILIILFFLVVRINVGFMIFLLGACWSLTGSGLGQVSGWARLRLGSESKVFWRGLGVGGGVGGSWRGGFIWSRGWRRMIFLAFCA